MTKFQNKYRIESTRLKNWDYGNNGAYFITICVKDRENLFGEIKDGITFLNISGETVEQIWTQIPEKFDYADLGEFVVMPNHFHGIIFINKDSTGRAENYQKGGGFAKDKNPMLNDNLSRIVRWFKGRVTFEIRKITPQFAWQSRFWDNIIRNENALKRIENYIIDNPKNWNEDKFYL